MCVSPSCNVLSCVSQNTLIVKGRYHWVLDKLQFYGIFINICSTFPFKGIIRGEHWSPIVQQKKLRNGWPCRNHTHAQRGTAYTSHHWECAGEEWLPSYMCSGWWQLRWDCGAGQESWSKGIFLSAKLVILYLRIQYLRIEAQQYLSRIFLEINC